MTDRQQTSNRSLIEFNHDFVSKIEEDPKVFAKLVCEYLNWSEDMAAQIDLLQGFGVRIIAMKHHSNGHVIEWGGKREAVI